ncbi:hypothetical protein EV368DRAFT_88626 [Lentinula lateritia]|nr:hypothetical protein EV368DRAFT_88626 [Lentinula lateritia]
MDQETIFLQNSSSFSPHHPWVDNTHEIHETLTEKEASYLLRIAEAQQTLCATEQAALDQKIQITKLILELHLCRQNKLSLENFKARRTALDMREILNDYGKSDGTSLQPKTYPATAPSSPPSTRLDISDDDSDSSSEVYRGDNHDMEEPWEENTETTSTKEGKDQNTEILYLDQAKVFYTERSSSRTTKGKGGHANQMLEAADKMSLPQRSSSQGPNTFFSDDAASNPMAPPLEKPKRGRGSRGGKSTTQSKGRKTSEQPPTPKSLPTVSPTSGYPPPPPSMGRQVPLPSKAPISEAIRREQLDILRDLDLGNVKATSYVEPRIALRYNLPHSRTSILEPSPREPTLPGVYLLRSLDTPDPSPIRPIRSYIDVLGSTTPTTQYY